MSQEEKLRLDLLLMQKTGYSREFAKDIISKGVTVDGRTVIKPGEKFPKTAEIAFTAPENIYVSRGGYKLEYALRYFAIDLRGKICLDAGASTGGFTDCMLQAGAARVYAVDVGTGQLAERLRLDPRVVSMENTDLRKIPTEIAAAFLTADLSFISLTKVMPVIAGLSPGSAVLLIKPQFEAGRGHLNKRGVVTDKKVHLRVIDSIYNCSAANGLKPLGHVESPITGQDGNIEYLLYAERG